MNKFIEQDAADYRLWSGGWRLGLLVARSVEKGKRGGDTSISQTRNGKEPAHKFAKLAGTSADRVLRHLAAWQNAAAEGHVPDAITLVPGQDVELDEEKLPDWNNYYPPVTGGRTGRTTANTLAKALEDATPEVIAEAVESLDEGDRAKAVVSIREGADMGGDREKKDRRSVTDEVQEDPDAAHYRLVRIDVARADDDIDRGTKTARDTRFTSERQELLFQRIDIHLQKVDLLKMAIAGTENVDWNAELDKLNQALEAMEGGS